jgi:hypothetical protein
VVVERTYKMNFKIAALLLCAQLDTASAFVSPKQNNGLIQSRWKPSRPLETSTVTRTTSLNAWGGSAWQVASSSAAGVWQAASSTVSAVTSSDLFSFFLQTLISYGVPAFFVVVIIAFAMVMFSDDEDEDLDFGGTAVSELYNDLYGNYSKKGGFLLGRLKKNKNKPRNLGVPSQEFIKLSNFNQKLDSYEYSVTAATKSKAAAAASFRSKSFDRALRLGLESSDSLPSYAKAELLEAEKVFLTEGKLLITKLQSLQTKLAKGLIDAEMESMMGTMGVMEMPLDPKPLNKTATHSSDKGVVERFDSVEVIKKITKVQLGLTVLENKFVQAVVGAVGPERAVGVRTALLGDIAARGGGSLLQQLGERPLAAVLQALDPESNNKSLFFTRFPGDVTASQVAGLREEVTAIVRTAKPGDEALVILQSGGGTVTGYGLAAAQLSRLKAKGLKLTIAVEQVAASGGYMMCCTADKIIASPFAVLGSIGVISDIPNVYDRLKQEGM